MDWNQKMNKLETYLAEVKSRVDASTPGPVYKEHKNKLEERIQELEAQIAMLKEALEWLTNLWDKPELYGEKPESAARIIEAKAREALAKPGDK